MSRRRYPNYEKQQPDPTYFEQKRRLKPGPQARVDRSSLRANIVSTALTDAELSAFEVMRKSSAPACFRPTRSQFLAHVVAEYVERHRRKDVPCVARQPQP